MELAFTVFGKPQPAGSKRAFVIRKGGAPTNRAAVTDDNAKSKPWQQAVKHAAITALDDLSNRTTLLAGALSFQMTFYVQRPKGHYGTGRNANTLKPSAPALPTVKPDVTKLVRGVEDALTGVVWRDDAQVTDQAACKRYGTPERCEIVVRFCPPVGMRVRESDAA